MDNDARLSRWLREDAGMPDEPHIRTHAVIAPAEPSTRAAPSAGWRDQAAELLTQVAAERCLDFEPTPAAVAAALPDLVDYVENLATAMNGHDRRWLAAVLAALSDQVERTSLPEPGRDVRASDRAGGA